MGADSKRGLIATRFGQIHYREAGAGPAIVLLHINQQSSDLMTELMQALAPSMRAIAMDYPSHGGSDHLAAQPSIADYAECARAVLEALGATRAVALGEATGAAVAVELAVAHPEAVHAVVLVNCPFLGDSAARAAVLEEMNRLRPGDETGFPRLRTIDHMLRQDPDHAPMQPTQSWMDRINRAQIEAGRDRWQALTALTQYDLGSVLERLRCPTLVLTGEHFYFGHRVGELRSRAPHARYETLPGARFCACWEEAEEIARRAAAFTLGL